MHASASQLALVLLLIGWKGGANLLSQSHRVESAKPITFRHSNENRSKYTLCYLTCGVLSSFCLKRGILSGFEGFWVRPLRVLPPNTLIVMQSNKFFFHFFHSNSSDENYHLFLGFYQVHGGGMDGPSRVSVAVRRWTNSGSICYWSQSSSACKYIA